jgi:hypothetical protein
VASQLDFGEAGGRLDQAERFLVPLAAALADRLAGMTERPPIDRCLAWLAGLAQMPVDGDVRHHRAAFQLLDKGRDVGSLVGAQRDRRLLSRR